VCAVLAFRNDLVLGGVEFIEEVEHLVASGRISLDSEL
jgi:hypothetical protein